MLNNQQPKVSQEEIAELEKAYQVKYDAQLEEIQFKDQTIDDMSKKM